ncbi:MAG: SOS response-associated peptidase [Prosthecobacter sp.]|nr:SOS response-associated peptidase [Prosthecobacter sp.]
MCGRYATKSGADIERVFNAKSDSPESLMKPRFNAAPTQLLPVIRGASMRELAALRWGLVPSWAKDPSIGAKMINARGETVAEKPSFRAAFKRRRCLVPMAGFYEWKKTPTGKVPYYIQLMNAEQFAVAGLWEHWPGGGGVEPIESYTVITTEANTMMRSLHDRMPVILPPECWDAWLDPEYSDATDLQAMLVPYPSDEMRAYPVSTRVNSPRNEGEDLVQPAE